MTDISLTTGYDSQTGLYHGLVYRNHPTPSGCDRFLLSKSTKEGYDTEREAAAALNALFPEVPPLDLSMCTTEAMASLDLPAHGTLTLVEPKDGEEPYVDLRDRANKPYPLALTPTQVERLSAAGRITEESCSGNDPELSAIYTHYEIVKPNRTLAPR